MNETIKIEQVKGDDRPYHQTSNTWTFICLR